MLVILATWEAEVRRIMARGQSGQIVHADNLSTISKIARAKLTGGVECLVCKCKALVQTPVPLKKKKKKKKKTQKPKKPLNFYILETITRIMKLNCILFFILRMKTNFQDKLRHK
jgi:hypothetical protein